MNKLLLSNSQIEKLNSYGYIIIDDFLPQTLYQSLLNQLKSSPSDSCYQIKPQHYNHVFSSDLITLPGESECYFAKFSLIRDRNNLNYLKDVFLEYLGPIMKAASNGAARFSIFPGAVRLRSGDLYRAHQDSFAGIVGYTFFLNEGWSWDYGGILTYVRDEFTAEAIFPKPNRLLLRNETIKHFHYLNTIEQFCQKDQYLLLGWSDNNAVDNSNFSLGSYYEF